jgi:major type 1 subunit fimbrin (pilin)
MGYVTVNQLNRNLEQNMKTNILAFAIFSSVFVASSHAADGTINFTGNITDDTCDISTASKTQTVALGTIGSNSFSAPGTTSAATGFSVVLSNCPAAHSNVSVKFDGTPEGGNPSVLALTDTPTKATGVGIQLRDADGSVLPLFADSKPVAINAGNATLNFSAAYVSTASTVTAGDANSTANFTVAYN